MVFGALIFAYAAFGLVVLDPQAVYSGDIGVKFVQAQALVAHHFTSLDLPYPGAFLDPQREFFPLRPPFVMTTGGETQTIFSPASAVLQAAGVAMAEARGMVLVSVIAAAGILLAMWRLSPPGDGVAVLVALGIASPLWFYAVTGWEHAPAVAFGCGALVCAVRGHSIAMLILAGVCLGIGATIRDEVLLLLPGILFAVWLRTRSWRDVAIAAAATAVPLVAAAFVEVQWFGRPVAAHLRHAVHLAQAAVHVTAAPNPDVPILAPMTLRDRYGTIVQYWLLGYGHNLLISAYAAGLAVAWVVWWKWHSSAGILAWVGAGLVLAAIDAREALVAPKFVAGLLRVAPYLVFAALPPPRTARGSSLHLAVAVTTLAYLVIAFAGVDTTGGKSLGPRLLLPLLPMLVVIAVVRIADYLRGVEKTDRWVGRAGAALIALAATIHVVGTAPTYYRRNADDAKTMNAIKALPQRVVVSDDEFTAQLLFPLYFRKTLLVADSPAMGADLGARLAAAGIPETVLVTRWADTPIGLPPYRKQRTERKGRMTLQYWVR
jgi:hypothetical protein